MTPVLQSTAIMQRKTITAMIPRSATMGPPFLLVRLKARGMGGLKIVVKSNFSLDGDLICRDTALKEVRKLLHVLQIHEGEWVL